ncbi:hypothetical protein ACJ6WF_46150 [Streptomyces sp. MMS24-I2-30]|uniref:hypothetical protein n=1 Tax=Streptomyces sp. MMS24-I2-30 TaxID=3351564 RepID=UPI003896C40A
MSPEHHAEARMLGTHLWTAIHGQLVLWRSLPGLHHHGETVLIELEQSLLRRLLPRQVTAEHRVPNPPVHPGPVTPAKESGSGCPARTAAALPAVGASDQRSGGTSGRTGRTEVNVLAPSRS